MDFVTKNWVRFGLRFGSVRFGPVRFSTRGSAEHRTFKIPGSVVLYCRDMMQNFFDGAGTLLSKCSVIIVLSLTP